MIIENLLRMSSSKGLPGHLAFLALFLVAAQGSAFFARTANSPVIVTVTSPVKLTVDQGGGVVRSRALELRNTGKTTLEWMASSNQAWLRFEPAAGSLSPKATASIELVADPAGFAPGIYLASAQIVSSRMRRQRRLT